RCKLLNTVYQEVMKKLPCIK
ncbi:hypothetical protein A5858_000351, partial [Enterococcus faecium]